MIYEENCEKRIAFCKNRGKIVAYATKRGGTAMGRLKRYLQPYWLYMILTMVIKLAGAGMELMIPDLMETILDEKVPAGQLQSIYIYGGLMLL